MILTTWGLLLLFSASVKYTSGAFPNLCAGESKGGPTVLPRELNMPTSYKLTAVFTDWDKKTTMLIDEIRNGNDYVVEIGSFDNRIKWSAVDNQLLRSNKTDCSVVNETVLFTIPLDISTVLPLEVSSLSHLLNSIIDKNISGTNKYERIVSGVEGIGFVGCVDVTNSSSVVVLEVVYAGEGSLKPPSTLFKNPLVLSISLSLYSNFSDANSTMTSRISLDFSSFLPPVHLPQIAHGQVCNGLDAANVSFVFPEVFEGFYSKIDYGASLVTSKLIFDSTRGLMAESVIEGRAIILNETFPADNYLVVHDIFRGVEFVFSSSPSCAVRGIPHEAIDISSNQTSHLIYLFLPQFDALKFSQYNKVTNKNISVIEYRSEWENKVIEVIVQDSTLKTISIYSNGELESVSELTIKETNSLFGDNCDVSSLLRGCFESSSNNSISFVLNGVPISKIMKWREDVVSSRIATTLVALPHADISPYRLSFFYIEDREGDSKNENTRVIIKVTEGSDQCTEITASQFITNLNATYPKGFAFHFSDSEVWIPTNDALIAYPPNSPLVPSFDGYTGGSMLVMALFMTMTGSILGAGGVYFVFRRQRISTLAYQVFE